MPGQALATFRRARELGMQTVLNHASGPVRQQLALIEGEYRRAGLDLAEHHGFDSAYFEREDAEYAAADYHCVASSIVRRQLQDAGVPSERIWVVPYAADPAVFHPPAPENARAALRVVYAGQLTQRKGLRVLFAAAKAVRNSLAVELHLYGPAMPDIAPDIAGIGSESWIVRHGAVPQQSDEETADESLLADDDAAHFLGEGPHPGAGLLDAAVEFLDGWIHAQGWVFKCHCGVGRRTGDEIPRHPSAAMT